MSGQAQNLRASQGCQYHNTLQFSEFVFRIALENGLNTNMVRRRLSEALRAGRCELAH